MDDHLLANDFLEEPWWWHAAPRPAQSSVDNFPDSADVVVVGSGFTGLSAALTLAKAGREVVVLDAQAPGYGASSRNAGFVGRTLKHSFGALLQAYGLNYATQVYRELDAAFDLVFELVSRENINCYLTRCGRFMGALTGAQRMLMTDELELRHKHLGHPFQMISESEQSEEIGAGRYVGGALIPDLGSIHPGLYHLGLLNAARLASARIIGYTPVTAVRSDGAEFQVDTPRGVLTARDVIVATNGYTNRGVPWLQRRVIPFHGYMIATDVLSEDVITQILPNNRTFHDYNNNLVYIRQAPDQPRLLMGAYTGGPVDRLSTKAEKLKRRLDVIFPELSEVKISRIWSGQCAGTFDLWPHVGMHNGVHYALGYCFAGLPMGTYLGDKAAKQVLGLPEAKTVFADRAFRSHPLYTGNPWFLPLVMRWHDRQDAAYS
jgi:glycine/D-amino acid oxidase-like deaminating enzyme